VMPSFKLKIERQGHSEHRTIRASVKDALDSGFGYGQPTFTAVYKDPNRHRTPTLILGFWISERQKEKRERRKKEKWWCYKSCKAKRDLWCMMLSSFSCGNRIYLSPL